MAVDSEKLTDRWMDGQTKDKQEVHPLEKLAPLGFHLR